MVRLELYMQSYFESRLWSCNTEKSWSDLSCTCKVSLTLDCGLVTPSSHGQT
jgi:hypothetical protein